MKKKKKKKYRIRDEFRFNNLSILLISVLLGAGNSVAKDPTPNLYLDVPAPILSQWNTDNILTVDDTIDGFTGATPKSYVYSSVDDSETAAAANDDVWDTNSVAYITWELDNGTGRAPGVQVLNDNLDYKYHNCIMASGETEHPNFPDTIVPKACNDPQGSSKRYFFQITETNTPVDLVFDLDVKDIRYKGLIDPDAEDETDSSKQNGSSGKDNTIAEFRDKYGIGRLYRVNQKIRNHTGKRVASYKFELGKGIGREFEPLNFEEHGVGFEMRAAVPREFFDGRTGAAPDVNTWETSRFATFAPKLFDDGLRPRFSEGFLDRHAAGFMEPEYTVDSHWKAQSIDSGSSIENDIIGSLSRNFFSVNETHDIDLPYDMFGYMLPNSQVPSVIGSWGVNDANAESDGVVAIWDGHNWRSGQAGLDGDPETLDDNFGIVPPEQLRAWADKPLGLSIPGEDPNELIRYAVIASDDLAGLNTDIFIHIGEKLLDEQSQPKFDSLTLRVTAKSVDDVLPGGVVTGNENPEWVKEGNAAPDLSTYATAARVAINDYVTTDLGAEVKIPVLDNDDYKLNNGDEISVEIVKPAINGTAVVNTDFSITYSPESYLTAGNEVFEYRFRIRNPGLNLDGVSNLASVTVVVNPDVVLGAPIVSNDNVMTMQETSVSIDVLANDTYTPEKQQRIRINNDSAHGHTHINEDKEIVFTPEPGFSGITQLTYYIEEEGDDGVVDSNSGVVTIRVDEPLEVDPISGDDNSVSSDGGGGGGCTMGYANAPIDPMLPLLLIISLIGIIRRRYQQSN